MSSASTNHIGPGMITPCRASQPSVPKNGWPCAVCARATVRGPSTAQKKGEGGGGGRAARLDLDVEPRTLPPVGDGRVMKDDEEGEAGAQRVDPRVAARRHRRFCLAG